MSERREQTVYLVLKVGDDAGCVCGRPHFWREIVGVFKSFETAKGVRDLYNGDTEEPHPLEVKAMQVNEGEIDEPWLGKSLNVRRGGIHEGV